MLKPGLVRFILASLVVFFHITGFIYIGTMAVYCFFILSGYWISFMYDAKYSKLQAPVTTFYFSRFYRILPVYYLFSVLSIILLHIYDAQLLDKISQLPLQNKLLFWGSNILLVGYNQLNNKIVVPAWSLDIEMQFYLVFPFLILLLKNKIGRLVILSASIILTVIFQLVITKTFLEDTLVIYLLYFVIGIILHKDNILFSRNFRVLCNTIFIIVLASHYVFNDLNVKIKNHASNYQEYFNQLIALLLIPTLARSVHTISNKLDRVLGDMSYVLYLAHWTLIIPYEYYIKGLTKIQRVPYTICYLLLTYSISYLLYKYFDLPIDKRRRQRAIPTVAEVA